MKPRKITVFDTRAVLHSSKYALGKSRLSHNEKHTFVIFGFIMRLRAILERERPDIVVFTSDSKSSKRKEIYHLYKDNRDKSKKTADQIELDELAYPQFDIVEKEILPELGYRNLFRVKGFEADDIMASICKTYPNDYITLVTTDKDMYQVLTNNVVIFKPDKYSSYTKKDFIKEYGIEPNLWKRVKTYGGCTSDNVPGIPIPDSPRNIGEGFALQFVKKTMKPHIKAYQAFVCLQNKKIIERNKKLVIIPFKGTPKFKLLPDAFLSRESLARIARKYGLKSVLKDIDDYSRVLKLR